MKYWSQYAPTILIKQSWWTHNSKWISNSLTKNIKTAWTFESGSQKSPDLSPIKHVLNKLCIEEWELTGLRQMNFNVRLKYFLHLNINVVYHFHCRKTLNLMYVVRTLIASFTLIPNNLQRLKLKSDLCLYHLRFRILFFFIKSIKFKKQIWAFLVFN